MDKGIIKLLASIKNNVSTRRLTTSIIIPVTIDRYNSDGFESRSDFNDYELYDVVDYLNNSDNKESLLNIIGVDDNDVDIVITNNNSLEIIVYSDEDITAVELLSTLDEIDFRLSLFVTPADRNYVLWVDRNNVKLTKTILNT